MPVPNFAFRDFSTSLSKLPAIIFQYLIDEAAHEFDFEDLKYDNDIFDQMAGRLIEFHGAILLSLYLHKIDQSRLHDDNLEIVDYAISRVLIDNKDITIGQYSELAELLEKNIHADEFNPPIINRTSRLAWNRYMDVRNLPIIDATVEFHNRGLDIRDICIDLYFQLLNLLKGLRIVNGHFTIGDNLKFRLFPFFYLRRSKKTKDRLLILKKSFGESSGTLYYEYDRYQSEIPTENIAIFDQRFGEIHETKLLEKIAVSISSPLSFSLPSENKSNPPQIELSHVGKFEKLADALIECLPMQGIFHIIKHSPFAESVQYYRDFDITKNCEHANFAKQAILYFFYSDSPLKPLFIALARTEMVEGSEIVNFSKNIDNFLFNNSISRNPNYILDKAIQKGRRFFSSLPQSLAIQIKKAQARYLVFQIGIELFQVLGIPVEKSRTQYPLIFFKTKLENAFDYELLESSERDPVSASSSISVYRDLVISSSSIMEKLFKIYLCFLKAITLVHDSIEESEIKSALENFYITKIKKSEANYDKGLESLFWTLDKSLLSTKTNESYTKLTGRRNLASKKLREIFKSPIDSIPDDIDISPINSEQLNFFSIRNSIAHRDYSFDVKAWRFLSGVFYMKCLSFIEEISNTNE